MENIHIDTITATFGGKAVYSDYTWAHSLAYVNAHFCHPQLIAAAMDARKRVRTIEAMNRRRVANWEPRTKQFLRNLDILRSRMADFRAAIAACECCHSAARREAEHAAYWGERSVFADFV